MYIVLGRTVCEDRNLLRSSGTMMRTSVGLLLTQEWLEASSGSVKPNLELFEKTVSAYKDPMGFYTRTLSEQLVQPGKQVVVHH